jgi:hypothetical protein
MPKKIDALFVISLIGLSLVLSACGLDEPGVQRSAAAPTIPEDTKPTKEPQNPADPMLVANSGIGPISNNPPVQPTCTYPTGWVPYQLQVNETSHSLAARAEITAEQIWMANCLVAGSRLGVGQTVYVPPAVLATSPDTLLPLGISAIVADPPVVSSGGTVNLTWQGQGPVVSVRVGWVYNGQFMEMARNLPKVGTWQLTVPNDGRESMMLMVRVGDGVQEVAAQTMVKISCGQAWFFAPAASGCPLPPLTTTFHEQTFERGRIVYVPALAAHYILIDGQQAIKVPDTYVPGMLMKDPGLEPAVPAGMFQPSGSLYYAWRASEEIRVALGWATTGVVEYTGMLQRAVDASGERVYFSASAGGVYRTGAGQAWALVFPQ